MVWNKIQSKAHADILQEATTLTKMTHLLYAKDLNSTSPTPSPYIKTLPRNLASAILRLRCGTTSAPANQTTGYPVCQHCQDGLASDAHYLSSCPYFKNLRNKYNITSIELVYNDATDIHTMTRYAHFIIDAQLAPGLY